MSPLLIYYHILLLVCALTGSILLRRSWAFWARLLVVLTWVTQVAEILAFFAMIRRVDINICYSLWIFLETLTLLYVLSRGTSLPWVKRLHIILMAVLPMGMVLYFILMPAFAYLGLFFLFLELMAAGAVLIDILADVSDVPMQSKPIFWLATGMLFYCSLYIVVFSLGQLLNTLPHDDFMPFGCLANTFMYGGFIACFVTLRRQAPKVLEE